MKSAGSPPKSRAASPRTASIGRSQSSCDSSQGRSSLERCSFTASTAALGTIPSAQWSAQTVSIRSNSDRASGGAMATSWR